MSNRIFDLLSNLTPVDINFTKLRVGSERDGGYMLADIKSQSDVVSFGVGPEINFEHELASDGRRVFLYDHTVESTPVAHENFKFHRVGICGEHETTPDLLPLSAHVANIGDLSDHSILKVDVEGYEWDVFSTISDEDLEKFDQIVIEMHWFARIANPFFAAKVNKSLRALKRHFSLFHVHANNFTELHIVDGFTVADVIEVSYIRTSLVETSPSRTLYPSPLNKANHPDHRDHALLFYPFLPLAVGGADVRDLVKRIDLEFRSSQGGAGEQFVNVAQAHAYEVSSVFANMMPHPFPRKPNGFIAFHTALEDQPWILFRFDSPLYVNEIVVHNRRENCQDRARSVLSPCQGMAAIL